MKITSVVLVLFASALSAQEVTFGSAPSPETWTDTGAYESTISLAAGKAAATRSMQRSKSSCLVSRNAGGRIAALEVTYANASDGEVVGKSYVVTSKGVTYAGGGVPTPTEIAFVRRDNRNFGHFRALERILAGRSIAIGSSLQPDLADAAELMSLEEDMNVRTLTLTLRSIDDGIATFDVAMSADGKGLRLVTTGTLEVVIATSLPRRMQLNGTIASPRLSGNASMNVAYRF